MLALLHVKYLCFKNRLKSNAVKKKDFLVYSILIIFPYLVFNISKEIFLELSFHPRFDLIILSKITASLLFALNLIVILASIVATIGNLYSAKDLNLLLTLPIHKTQIFLTKFISIFIESSWTVFLFLLPILFSFATVLNLPTSYYLISFISVFLLTAFSTSIGVIISCVAVSRISPKACLEIVVTLMSLSLVYFMVFTSDQSPNIAASKNSAEQIIGYFSSGKDESYLAHNLASKLISSYWDSSITLNSIFGLITVSFTSLILANLCYCKISVKNHKSFTRKNKLFNRIFKPVVITKRNLLRGVLGAFISKENKIILRDLSQASQFLILIFVTFVYLLNFQQLKNKPNIDTESIQLWYVLLALSNISMGSCILTAIATRFVFPSISMEGKCFSLLKCAPLKMSEIVFYKFTTWLIPFCITALIVLLAGAFAIDANNTTILFTGFIAINLSLALVSTAIGTGAKYSRFDWDSPTQIVSGFGSLILMFKSLFIVFLYISMASIPIIIFNIGKIEDASNILICTLIITLIIMVSRILVRDNLRAGCLRLEQI